MTQTQTYFARVKPYNLKRGHVVRRIKCMGKLWTGGSGLPPDTIPTWTQVNAAQAAALKQFLQLDNDPYSQPVFDIVTPEQKAGIDEREENYRKAALGFGGPASVGELPNVAARVDNESGQDAHGQLKADGSRLTMDDLRGAPAPSLPVADIVTEQVGTLQDFDSVQPNASPITAQEHDISGRMDAAAELTTEPSPGTIPPPRKSVTKVKARAPKKVVKKVPAKGRGRAK